MKRLIWLRGKLTKHGRAKIGQLQHTLPRYPTPRRADAEGFWRRKVKKIMGDMDAIGLRPQEQPKRQSYVARVRDETRDPVTSLDALRRLLALDGRTFAQRHAGLMNVRSRVIDFYTTEQKKIGSPAERAIMGEIVAAELERVDHLLLENESRQTVLHGIEKRLNARIDALASKKWSLTNEQYALHSAGIIDDFVEIPQVQQRLNARKRLAKRFRRQNANVRDST